MLEQHRSHIISTWSTVGQRLEEVRQVITRGRSPGGSAVALLPEGVREDLLAALDRFSLQLDDLVREYAPENLAAAERAADRAAARMWVSVLLRTIQELIENLLPQRLTRRYGRLEQDQTEDLTRRVDDMLISLRRAIEVCDQIGEADASRGEPPSRA